MSMPAINYTVTGIGVSPIFAADHFQSPFNIGVGVTVSATATYTVQYTFDDIMADGYVPASGTWFTDATFGTATATKSAAMIIPCRGVRLNVSASTGSVTIQIQQAGER